MAEQKKVDMNQQITSLEAECEQKQKEIEDLDVEIEDMIRNDEEERGKEQKAHEENVKHLKDLI